MFDTLITIVLIVFVFFVSVIFDITIFGVILTTALFYAFWYYYRKSKVLQKRLRDSNAGSTDAPADAPQDSIPPPPSTDA
jgi:chromate transport protein ChrA